MKKKIIFLLVTTVICISTFLSACSNDLGDQKDFQISEMTTGCYAFIYNENPYAGSDWVEVNPDEEEVAKYVNDTDFYQYHHIGFALDTSKVAGEEFVCAEIDITADRDTKVVLAFYYHGVKFVDDMEIELKAGEKTTLSFEFNNPFVVKKADNQIGANGFLVMFDTNEFPANGNDRWKDWVKTKYNFSRIELTRKIG